MFFALLRDVSVPDSVFGQVKQRFYVYLFPEQISK